MAGSLLRVEIERLARELLAHPEAQEAILSEYTISQRVAIASKVEELCLAAHLAKRAEGKRRQAKIRAMTPKDEPESCLVCGASRLICQRHHIHPVALSDPTDPACTRYEWLCPNCHTILHVCMRVSPLTSEFFQILTSDQWDIIHDLLVEMEGGQR